jgi:hypothetical protein
MLDTTVIRVVSILFVVGTIIRLGMLTFFSRKRQDMGSVKASKPTGFILHQLWLFLDILLPLIFCLLAIIVPTWVYGTLLNISFTGAEVLQLISIPLFVSGVILVGAAYRAIGQLLGRGGIRISGETRASNQRTLLPHQTPNPHRNFANGLSLHPPIPPHRSIRRLSHLHRHSLQEGSSGRRTSIF